MANVPPHLQKYCVKQSLARYTHIDHAVWRFIMRQLKSYLSQNAHPSYLDGLNKAGIGTERIPSIEDIDKHIQAFGWAAVPVSGFIPPAAFMELQSLGILPIASDMRTVDHLDYTPAPDIVHEAAGHAPILANPEFSAYLHRYAQVASKAILHKEDLDQYEAIRELSDLKESPVSTAAQITAAEKALQEVSDSIQDLSEGALLARMNWWTAEYGLIGDIEHPQIYGAGLLSSVGESRWALTEKVKKIPFSVKCIDYGYDITEPQPQLFVTPNFEKLSSVLEEFADTMAFRRGGSEGLNKAKFARTVNTVELNSGLQISGVLKDASSFNGGVYLQFQGPSQLSYKGQELKGHGRDYHREGFGSPVGLLKGQSKCLSLFTNDELKSIGLVTGQKIRLEYQSGVVVDGTYQGATTHDRINLIFKFGGAKVINGSQILFKPEWGDYDMAVGSAIPSVFGGPADRIAYGEVTDFAAKRVPVHEMGADEQRMDELFQAVRQVREKFDGSSTQVNALEPILKEAKLKYPKLWLLKMELLELACAAKSTPAWKQDLEGDLRQTASERPQLKDSIEMGLKLAKENYH